MSEANVRLIERAQRGVALDAVVLDEEPHPVVERRPGTERLFAQQDVHWVGSDPAVETVATGDVDTAVWVLAVDQPV